MRIVTNGAVDKFLELARSRNKPSGSFTFGKTTVSAEEAPFKNQAVVFMRLNGNTIARAVWRGPTLHSFDFTLAGYHTDTTKERINGLLWRANSACKIFTEDFNPRLSYRTLVDGVVYFGKTPFDPHKRYTLVRYSDGAFVLDFASLDSQQQEHIRRTLAEKMTAPVEA